MSETSIVEDTAYSQITGTKLRLVHPSDAVKNFNYSGATGAISVKLAKFGRYQTGTSIQAPLYYPPVGIDACREMTPPDNIKENFNMQWQGFVIVHEGGCTYEEKARNVQAMGA